MVLDQIRCSYLCWQGRSWTEAGWSKQREQAFSLTLSCLMACIFSGRGRITFSSSDSPGWSLNTLNWDEGGWRNGLQPKLNSHCWNDMKLAAGKNPQLRRQSELSEFETKNRKIVVKRRYKFSRQTRTCLQRHKHKLNLVILNKDKESEKEQKTSSYLECWKTWLKGSRLTPLRLKVMNLRSISMKQPTTSPGFHLGRDSWLWHAALNHINCLHPSYAWLYSSSPIP